MEQLPVTTATGAHVLAATDGEVHLASVPAMFDIRFAIAAACADEFQSSRDAVRSWRTAVAAALCHAAAERPRQTRSPVAAVAEPAEQPSQAPDARSQRPGQTRQPILPRRRGTDAAPPVRRARRAPAFRSDRPDLLTPRSVDVIASAACTGS